MHGLVAADSVRRPHATDEYVVPHVPSLQTFCCSCNLTLKLISMAQTLLKKAS